MVLVAGAVTSGEIPRYKPPLLRVLIAGIAEFEVSIYRTWMSAEREFNLKVEVCHDQPWSWILTHHRGGISEKQRKKFIRLLKEDLPVVKIRSGWWPHSMPEELQKELVDYVRRGGCLIFSRPLPTRSVHMGPANKPKVGTTRYWRGGPLSVIIPTRLESFPQPFYAGLPEGFVSEYALRRFGKGKVLIVDVGYVLDEDAPYRRATDPLFTYKAWNQIFRWLVDPNAFPATVDIVNYSKKILAGGKLWLDLALRNYSFEGKLRLWGGIRQKDGSEVLASHHEPLPTFRTIRKKFEMVIPSLQDGEYIVEVALVSDSNSIIHSAVQRFEVSQPLETVLTTDQDGYEPGERIDLTVAAKNLSAKSIVSDLVLNLTDYRSRILQQKRLRVELQPSSEKKFRVRFVMKSYPKGVYWIRALRDGNFPTAECEVLRYGKFSLREKMRWTGWIGGNNISSDTSAEEIERWVRLFRRLGYTAFDGGLFELAKEKGFEVWNWAGSNPPRSPRQFERFALSSDEELVKLFEKEWLNHYIFRKLPSERGKRDPYVWHPLRTVFAHNFETVYCAGIAHQSTVWQLEPYRDFRIAYAKVFREWLKKKYGSLRALNEEWGTSYERWWEIHPQDPYLPPRGEFVLFNPSLRWMRTKWWSAPLPRPQRNPVAWFDQWRFFWETQERFWRLWSEALRRVDKYEHKTLGMYAADIAPHSGTFDLAGFSWGIWGQWKNRIRYGAGPYFSTTWAFFGRHDLIRTNIWRLVAFGSRYIDFWNAFAKYFYVCEFADHAPTATEAWNSVTAKALEEGIALVNSRQKAFLDSVNFIADDLCFFTSYPYNKHPFGLPHNDEPSIGDQMDDYGFADALHRSGFSPDVTDRTSELGRYKVVIASGALYISREEAREFERFVRGGGALFVFPAFAKYDRHGKLLSPYPGWGLAESFGFELAPSGKAGEFTILKSSLLERFQGRKYRSQYRDLIVRLAPSAEVLAEYGDGCPALVRNRVGAGTVFLINARLKGMEEFVRRLFERLVLFAGAKRFFRLAGEPGDALRGLDAVMLQTDDRSVRYILVWATNMALGDHGLSPLEYPDTTRIVLEAERFSTIKAPVREGAVVLSKLDPPDRIVTRFTIDKPGIYKLWARVYYDRTNATAGDANSFELKIDGSYKCYSRPGITHYDPPRRFGDTPITDRWVWESGADYKLSAGEHTIEITATETPVLIDKIVFAKPRRVGARLLLESPLDRLVIYDSYAGKLVAPRKLGTQNFIPVYLQPTEARLFSFLPYRAKAPQAKLNPRQITAGQDINIEVRVVRESGKPAYCLHSLQINVYAPDGSELRSLSRLLSVRGGGSVSIPTALSDPKGKWVIRILDATTGLSTAVPLTVQ